VIEYLLKYWAGWLCGILGSVILGAWTMLLSKYKKLHNKQCAIELGVQALLRSQLIQLYNKYMEIGAVPIYERENIEQLYIQYENLGGNGVMTELLEKLNALPTPRV